MNNDESNLKLLSTFHYVLAAACVAFSSLFAVHFVWGLAVWQGVPFTGAPHDMEQPREFGLMLMAMGAGVVLLGWTFAACLVVAGRSLAQRTRYLYCMIVAGLMCALCNPFGTVLGVFTFVVLLRPSVRALFGEEPGTRPVA